MREVRPEMNIMSKGNLASLLVILACIPGSAQVSSEAKALLSDEIVYAAPFHSIRITPKQFEYRTIWTYSKTPESGAPSPDDEHERVNVTGRFDRESFSTLARTITRSGFLDLPDEIGSAAKGGYKGRYYPYRIRIRIGNKTHNVLWKSSPGS